MNVKTFFIAAILSLASFPLCAQAESTIPSEKQLGYEAKTDIDFEAQRKWLEDIRRELEEDTRRENERRREEDRIFREEQRKIQREIQKIHRDMWRDRTPPKYY